MRSTPGLNRGSTSPGVAWKTGGVLRGRQPEIRRISALVDAVRRGEGEVLLLHGPPGIGKTALLEHAEHAAEGLTVLRVRGYEAETALPFAQLRRLLAPVERLRDRLPPVQAQALAGALDGQAVTPPAGVAVPMAVLTMLAAAAEERPVLLVVDDLQWLDPASREALLFVARRLGRGPVGLLLAGREPVERSGLPQHAVPPLDDAEAHALLERLGQAPAPPVRSVIVGAAAGNPLALLELAASLRPEQRTGEAPLDVPLRPGPLLRAAFGRRVERLAVDDRRAVTVAAAMEHGSVAWLLAALDVLGIDADAISAAERDGLLVVRDGRAWLTHSVLRAVVYHDADPEQRRDAHRALAATADDPPRRAWHLAAAADDADEGIAAELDRAAERSRSVGGHAEAAAAFVRAAELSSAPADRARRELAAAQDLAAVGEHAQALLRLEAASEAVGDAGRPAVERLRGNLAMRRGDPGDALRTLTAAGEHYLAAGQHEVAAELFLEASVAPMMTGDIAAQAAVIERARVAARPVGGALRTLADLVAAEILVVCGDDGAGDAALAAACARIEQLDPVEHGEIAGMAAQTSLWVGAFDRATAIVAWMVDVGRASGALGRLPYPLTVRAQLAYRQGRWADAARDLAEAVQLARDSGQEPVLAFALSVRGRLHAVRGEDDAARTDLDEAVELVERHQAAGIATHVYAALVLTELLDGAYDAAIDAAGTARALETRLGHRQPAATMWGGDAIEALVAAGRADSAAGVVDELAAHARETGSRWAAMVAARGAVLLAPDERIDAAAAAARACDVLADLPLERARTELVIGERLRRAHRRGDAREPLARAAAELERIGATAFLARARVGHDAADTTADDPPLTAVERRIVRLVGEGRTNRELAAELHLGQKTLERRLSALYRKLGVSSRTALARFDRR
jgi:DNA-binding NarL/FixJ family response regulator